MKIIEQEINGEKVYLKKDILGWRVVYPVKIDGKINWFNLLFGGKKMIVTLIIYLIIAFLIFKGINELTEQCRILANDPCAFCSEMITKGMGGQKLEWAIK